MSIELVFADPHPVMLDGLDSVFRDASGFSVCSSVHDGEAASRDANKQIIEATSSSTNSTCPRRMVSV